MIAVTVRLLAGYVTVKFCFSGMDLSRSCRGERGGGGGGGVQVRCCVSNVHRPSPMEAGVTVVGIFAGLNYSNYCITVCFH